MPVIDFVSCINTNKLGLGDLKVEAYNDRIIVVEDEFRSGYECGACKGTGSQSCKECNGLGYYAKGYDTRLFKCSTCEGKGTLTCSDCGGKAELLVIPDSTKRRPTTGRIVSVGNLVTPGVVCGESVLYPSFCGHVFDLNAIDEHGHDVQISIRIIRESEIISKVEGHLDLRRVASRVSAPDAI